MCARGAAATRETCSSFPRLTRVCARDICFSLSFSRALALSSPRRLQHPSPFRSRVPASRPRTNPCARVTIQDCVSEGRDEGAKFTFVCSALSLSLSQSLSVVFLLQSLARSKSFRKLGRGLLLKVTRIQDPGLLLNTGTAHSRTWRTKKGGFYSRGSLSISQCHRPQKPKSDIQVEFSSLSLMEQDDRWLVFGRTFV